MHTTRRAFLAAGAGIGLTAVAGSITAAGTRTRAQPSAGGDKPVGKKLGILVLGGTGFLGPHTVRAALARGHTVTMFNRGRTEARRKEIGRELEFMDDVETLYGNRDPLKAADDYKPAEQRDPKSPMGMTQLEGRTWDAVIDNSGYYPRMVKASTELLAKQSAKQYVFISSISVYKSDGIVGADETDPCGTISDPTVETMGAQFENYGPLKALCEQAAESAFPGKATNIRPGLIVGPGDNTDRFTYWPVRVARGGEVLAPGSHADPIQFIDVRDLAEWIVTAVENRSVGFFNAVGPRPCPEKSYGIGELLDACKQVSGSDAKFTWCDAAFLREKEVSPWGDMPIWIPAEGDSLGSGMRSNRAAVAAGMTFRSVEDTVKATLEFWKSLPADRQSKLAAGITGDREQLVLAEWHKRKGGG
ncbi:MAG: NAD-dependent epimerase/dehydratase family protein [Phycisphaerales bacterium]